MKAKHYRLFLVSLFVLSMVLSGCSRFTSVQEKSALAAADTQVPIAHTATLTSSPTDTATPIIPSTSTPSPAPVLVHPPAQDLALNPEDLGTGWRSDAAVNDLDASYYFDRGEDGVAIIGTHRNTSKPPVDPEQVDTITMRGFSQPDQGLVLFHFVAVFKETEQAQEAVKRFAQKDCDPPCEYAHQYDDGSGERYVYREASIADESILTSVWLLPESDEDLPLGRSIHFRKENVVVYLLSIGKYEDLSSSPAVSEDHLVELAQIVETRIP
jgi:hypothetical protein